MKKKKQGFTLSEVIITLVVLGIVAAITVPMMSNSASDKKWNVARQKAQATIGEAFRLMTVNGEIDTKLSTQQFVEKIIPKYLKLEKTCGSGAQAAKNCGFNYSLLKYTWKTQGLPQGITGAKDTRTGRAPSSETNPTTQNYNNSYFFKTLDGFSVNFFYNPYCAADFSDKQGLTGGQYSLDAVCFNAIYDMNGKKGPNKMGKDIGIVGSIYNGFNVKAIAVLPYKLNISVKSLPGSGSYIKRGVNYCNNLGEKGSFRVANLDELSLFILNNYSGTSLVGNSVYFSHNENNGYSSGLYIIGDIGNGLRGGVNISQFLNVAYINCVYANILK